mmetsp:Transcript_2578/g.6602  ORF Transcript_2578/g.6602 Transcript_2578/m.6602 type:complete len:221 (-) Transcript_2578:808-1470(-)
MNDASSVRRRWISFSFNASMLPTSRTVFTTGLFAMELARSANLSVDTVSSKAFTQGEIAAMIVVLQLPPRESCSKLVSLESRYGTCLRATPPVSALTTPASALKELLMAVSSLMRSDPISVSLFQRSLPARSMKLTLLRTTMPPALLPPVCGMPAGPAASPFTPWLLTVPAAAAGPSAWPGHCSISSCRMAWLRELFTFISVWRTTRLLLPLASSCRTVL